MYFPLPLFSFYYLIDHCQVFVRSSFHVLLCNNYCFSLTPCNVPSIRCFCLYFSLTCLTSDYYSAINRIGITVIRVWCQIQCIDVLVRTLNSDSLRCKRLHLYTHTHTYICIYMQFSKITFPVFQNTESNTSPSELLIEMQKIVNEKT